MNRHVNAISGRLSLRHPQRRSLEILDRVMEILPRGSDADLQAALDVICSEYPTISDFEREFPSLCFALATGVGKTRLMGAFISYLHLAHGINNFFVLAPNLTIYNKLIADFTPNTPKYVFKGIAEFATESPEIITGDNYESKAGTLFDQFIRCRVNIFNISKINSEVRGGKSPRIKRLSEYIGESYFEYLAGLPDLVLLMDESHRYRASAGVKAINELKPIIGLELTATPFVETNKGAVPFKNVIIDYPLGKAMEDGFVKEPAVVTRKGFLPEKMSKAAVEDMKLRDGVGLHESVKVELETYALQTGQEIVKPFLLVIARDTTHAKQLFDHIESDDFYEGAYRGKVIQVDSSKSGAAEEEMVERLLKVEHADEPTEIVIHVNMLKEGWDVTNLYTIVPLRAANARILIEQSIGRGLRLPYGNRTGVTAVDRLNIVAHDKFEEIIEEARRPDSAIRLQQVILEDDPAKQKTVAVVAQSQVANKLGFKPAQSTSSTFIPESNEKPIFTNQEDLKVAQIAFEVIRKMENRPKTLPSVSYLSDTEIQKSIVAEVQERYRPRQMELGGIVEEPDFAAVVAKTAAVIQQDTIDIPRILVVPQGEVKSGFQSFTLDLSTMSHQSPDEELWIQTLRTSEREVLSLGNRGYREERPEDYIVSALVDFDDVSYDENAELLYDLASQVMAHYSNLRSPEAAEKILQCFHKEIAQRVHLQMQEHYWEEVAGSEVRISKGFTELKQSAYTASKDNPVQNFRQPPADKSNMSKYLFGGFSKCLYPVQKFDSDSERKLAVILDRDAQKWFKPAIGQFQIYYKHGAEHSEYQPDFVAETEEAIYMLEPKSRKEVDNPVVLAKKDAAVEWCKNASTHTASYGGKPWIYLLIPHDEISENMDIKGLEARHSMRS
ncbi:MAG: DEAD/DEAH box helicase family protein [Pontiellaceae bacterium]|nr:DEAD/DEAH box helicase family protein [Pontiellaceae bacterium]